MSRYAAHLGVARQGELGLRALRRQSLELSRGGPGASSDGRNVLGRSGVGDGLDGGARHGGGELGPEGVAHNAQPALASTSGVQVDQRGAARLADLEGRGEGGEGGEEGKSDGEELLGGGARWDVSRSLAGGKRE